jgi:uncharacterized membrane protein
MPSHNTPIEASVTIHRPIDAVFSFYRDLTNLPRFLGDVVAVEQIDRATYRWTIQGPLGIRTRQTVRLTDVHANALIRYETIAAPGLRTYWTIQFVPASDGGDTIVREMMEMPLGRFGRFLLASIGKFPAGEVAANLRRLKEIMETGHVTDTRYAVRGKFSNT